MNDKIDARFLLERELAGVPRDALMAIYPRRYWPAEWTDNEAQEPAVQDHEEPDDDAHRT